MGEFETGAMFIVEMRSGWGDTWTWVDVPVDLAQVLYDALGSPNSFSAVGTPDNGDGDGEEPRHGTASPPPERG